MNDPDDVIGYAFNLEAFALMKRLQERLADCRTLTPERRHQIAETFWLLFQDAMPLTEKDLK